LAGGSDWDPPVLFAPKNITQRAFGECEKNVVIFRKRVAGLTEAALSRFIGKASHAAGLKGKVDVLIAGNRELRLLNNRFLGKDKPTDVLSFPSEPCSAKLCPGEIAISAEIASENARLLGHNIAEEIKVLILHGILHLAGYDHEQDKVEMARKELRLRTALMLPAGLIERRQQPRAPGKSRNLDSRKKLNVLSARQTR
jgi:probable rRNA maturation factor